MSPLEYGDLIDSPAEGMMTTQEPAGAWHLGGGWDVQLYCFDLQLHAKFHNPRTTPSARKVCGTEKNKIIPNIVDTSFRSNAQGH